MNVISWESGETTITDFPACADPLLARVVQRVNDTICTHRTKVDQVQLLCPECSMKVLDLGHRTVGTSSHGLDDEALKRVYATIAVEEAESIRDRHDEIQAREVCALVRRYLAGGDVSSHELRYAGNLAHGAAYSAASAACSDTLGRVALGAGAACAWAAKVAGRETALERAHRTISRFEQLTGLTPSGQVDPEATKAAVAAMSNHTMEYAR